MVNFIHKTLFALEQKMQQEEKKELLESRKFFLGLARRNLKSAETNRLAWETVDLIDIKLAAFQKPTKILGVWDKAVNARSRKCQ